MTGTFLSAWPRFLLLLFRCFLPGHPDQPQQAGAEEDMAWLPSQNGLYGLSLPPESQQILGG
jgi:hypothetical protein